jgi:TRAP-type C4-dicarboxylate transport system substrate-binding protein
MTRYTRLAAITLALAVASGTALLLAQVRIRAGTIVPRDTLWHRTLEYIAQDWRRLVGPGLDMKIYPGGQLGDEIEMVRQARGGAIQVVGLSSVGLSRIDDGVSCLQVPMMLQSYDELDYVRDRVAPALERRIEARGFKVLHWADGGWVYAFSKQPVRTPDELRRLRLFTSAGDAETERVYKDLGFNVVPTSATDMIPMLQAGKLDAFAIVPLFAQVQELYKLAPHMTNVKWTPLVGGTVITMKAWDSLPDAQKPALLEAARKPGARLRNDIREQDRLAVQEMQKRGLDVVQVDPATLRLWQAEAEKAFPKLRGRYCPADVFDDVKRLRDEFRARATTTPAPPAGSQR